MKIKKVLSINNLLISSRDAHADHSHAGTTTNWTFNWDSIIIEKSKMPDLKSFKNTDIGRIN